MSQNRRKFLSTAFLTAGTLGLGGKVLANHSTSQYDVNLPKSIEDLSPMKEGVVPITVDERKQRIVKAQAIMEKEKIDAIFLEGTVSCFYFTGMRWGQSERTFGVVIPAKGPIAYVCPKFEEDRAMELLNPVFGDEVRCWEEHESPYALIFNIIKDRGTKYKKI